MGITCSIFQARLRYVFKVLTGSHPGEIKYYPKIVRAKTIDTDEIAELLQQRTTLSDSEVRAFLNGLSQAISYYVCASYPVEVEGLGRFTPAIKAKAMDSPEAVTVSTITQCVMFGRHIMRQVIL